MRTRAREHFTTVTTEGAILSADIRERVADGDGDLECLRREDYHLSGDTIGEGMSRAWNRMLAAWRTFSALRERLSEGNLGTTPTRENRCGIDLVSGNDHDVDGRCTRR